MNIKAVNTIYPHVCKIFFELRYPIMINLILSE